MIRFVYDIVVPVTSEENLLAELNEMSTILKEYSQKTNA